MWLPTQLDMVTGRFAPSPVCPPDVSPHWRIQRFLVTLYILSFIIVKLCLTTFIKVNANDDDDPAYSVKTQAPGAKRPGANWRRGETSINQKNRYWY